MLGWDRSHDWVLHWIRNDLTRVTIKFRQEQPSIAELAALRRCLPRFRHVPPAQVRAMAGATGMLELGVLPTTSVIHRDVFSGFLEKVAGNLLRELVRLEAEAPHAPAAHQSQVTTVLASLRAKFQQMIDLITGLCSYRTASLEQLRSMVSQVPLLRDECVRLIQELEHCFQVPRPFYQSRPEHSTASVNAFLDNLERMFVEERSTSDGKRKHVARSVENHDFQ